MSALLHNSLGVVCPSCDFLNVVAASKCTSCSAPTDAAAKAGGAKSPAAADSSVPPGLKRTSPSGTHAIEAPAALAATAPSPSGKAPALGSSPVAPSGPARPTFQSSQAPAAQPAPAAGAA